MEIGGIGGNYILTLKTWSSELVVDPAVGGQRQAAVPYAQ